MSDRVAVGHLVPAAFRGKTFYMINLIGFFPRQRVFTNSSKNLDANLTRRFVDKQSLVPRLSLRRFA